MSEPWSLQLVAELSNGRGLGWDLQQARRVQAAVGVDGHLLMLRLSEAANWADDTGITVLNVVNSAGVEALTLAAAVASVSRNYAVLIKVSS